MGTITLIRKKRSGISFRAEVRREGKRLTKCFGRKTDANDWIKECESSIRAGTLTPILKRFTVAQAIDRYILEVLPQKRAGTQRVHKAQLLWFKGKIGDIKLCHLNSLNLSEARDLLRSEVFYRKGSKKPFSRSASTANRYFVPLLHCFRICCEDWMWLRTIPRLRRYQEPRGRTRYLTPDEARALISALDRDPRKDVRLVTLISLTLGTRLGETCALQWNDIDFEQRTIIFRETKSGEVKVLPIPDRLLAEFAAWRETSTNEHLFPTTCPSKRPHIYDRVTKVVRKLAQRLGLKGVVYHSLRHTVGSWATQAGANRKLVAEVLGHRVVSTSDRYSHLEVEHLRKLVESVEANLSESTSDERAKTIH